MTLLEAFFVLMVVIGFLGAVFGALAYVADALDKLNRKKGD